MSNHQKRLSAPKHYPIQRKEGSYVAKAKGPHAQDRGLPLVVVLRDMLEYAESKKEVQAALSDDQVLVDGRVRRSPMYTVGFMDVINFPELDEAYRLLLDKRGFVLQPVNDAEQKLVRVDGKTTLTGGVTQLNLYDGNNIEVDEDYSTKSSLLVSLPDMDVEAEYAFEEGNTAFISGGQHAGVTATITEIRERSGSQQRRVLLETDDGEQIETVEEYVYMVGGDAAEVELNGE